MIREQANPILRRVIRRLATLHDDRSGAVAVVFALALPVLVGVVGLGVEASHWYTTRESLQVAADAGALAGALERANGDTAGIAAAAAHDAAQNGFTPVGQATFTVNYPPQSGAYAGRTDSVEVIVSQPLPRLFSLMFLKNNPTVTTRAVAQVVTKSQACILALDSKGAGAVTITGNTTLNLADCVIAANSNSGKAITLTGSSQLKAQSLWTAGSYSLNGAATMDLERDPVTNASTLADPFSDLTVTAPNGCTRYGARFNHGHTVLTPGVYCNGLSLNGQASVVLEPGTYYIDGGDLSVNGQASLTCDCGGTGSGVTIVMTATQSNCGHGGSVGTVTINGGGTVNLQAPSDDSYTYPGMVLIQDPKAPGSTGSRINGNGNVVLNGAIYMPNSSLQWSGDSSQDGTGCLQIVADDLTFTGNSSMELAGCQAEKTRTVTVNSVHLVE